jgi:glycosyltransferase involved in cell wall biosynthesis
MEQELGCRFYFGDRIAASNIKRMDYSLFTKKPGTLRYIWLIGYFNWLGGSLRLCFQPYQVYILTGEPRCLSSWVVLLINRIRGRETWLWTHGWYGDETPAKKQFKKAYFKLANKVLLYGDHARNLMLSENIPASKLNVIYNSLAYTKQIAIRSQLRKTPIYADYFGNKSPLIVFIGRLEPQKKLRQLIEAVKLLPFHIKPNVCIIGDGKDREALEKRVADLNLTERVWFYGACYEEATIASLLYNADICVSPGEVGLTAMHAMSYGTPVITHNDFSQQMPEFEAIIPNQTGLFFERDKVKSLSNAIQDWLKAHPVKSEASVQACFEVIDTYYNPNHQMKLLRRLAKNV